MQYFPLDLQSKSHLETSQLNLAREVTEFNNADLNKILCYD